MGAVIIVIDIIIRKAGIFIYPIVIGGNPAKGGCVIRKPNELGKAITRPKPAPVATALWILTLCNVIKGTARLPPPNTH